MHDAEALGVGLGLDLLDIAVFGETGLSQELEGDIGADGRDLEGWRDSYQRFYDACRDEIALILGEPVWRLTAEEPMAVVWFGLAPDAHAPQVILTTLAPDESYGSSPQGVGRAGFFSISTLGGGLNPGPSAKDRPEYFYKIFSPMRVNATFLANILGVAPPAGGAEDKELSKDDVSWVYRKLWHSYPYEYPRITFEEIRLDKDLWYTSGIESFISTMETSALMGMNIARLVTDEWAGEKDKGEKKAENAEYVKVQPEDGYEKVQMAEKGQKPIEAKL